MGNSKSQITDSCFFKAFNQNQWQIVRKDGLQLWRNVEKNTHCVPYKMPLKDSIEDLQRYQFRYLHGFYLVKVVNIIRMKQDPLLTCNINNIILIEHVVGRLSDVQSLTFLEALIILKAAFHGFSLLYSFYGIFQIQSDMICFNEQGSVKVWLNKDLNVNHSVNKISKEQTITQKNKQLIIQKTLKIFTLVEQKLQNGFDDSFLEGVSLLQSFVDASQFIQYYIEQNKIKLTSHLNLQSMKLLLKNNKQSENMHYYPPTRQKQQHPNSISIREFNHEKLNREKQIDNRAQSNTKKCNFKPKAQQYTQQSINKGNLKIAPLLQAQKLPNSQKTLRRQSQFIDISYFNQFSSPNTTARGHLQKHKNIQPKNIQSKQHLDQWVYKKQKNPQNQSEIRRYSNINLLSNFSKKLCQNIPEKKDFYTTVFPQNSTSARHIPVSHHTTSNSPSFKQSPILNNKKHQNISIYEENKHFNSQENNDYIKKKGKTMELNSNQSKITHQEILSKGYKQKQFIKSLKTEQKIENTKKQKTQSKYQTINKYECPEDLQMIKFSEINYSNLAVSQRQSHLNQTLMEDLKILEHSDDCNRSDSPMKRLENDDTLHQQTVESDVDEMEGSEELMKKLTRIKIDGLMQERKRRQTEQFKKFLQPNSQNAADLTIQEIPMQQKKRNMKFLKQKKSLEFANEGQCKLLKVKSHEHQSSNLTQFQFQEAPLKYKGKIKQSHDTFYTNNDPYGINAKYEKYVSNKNDEKNSSYYFTQKSIQEVKTEKNKDKKFAEKKVYLKKRL